MQHSEKTVDELILSFIEVLANSNEKFIDMCRNLETKKSVATVIRDLEFRNYESGKRLELYIEATTKTNKSVCWFVDCSFEMSSLSVTGKVYLTDDLGQNLIQEYPDFCTASIGDFIDNFKKVISLIENSINLFDFDFL